MGEGVSLSLPRKGVPDADLLSAAVSVPSTREYGCLVHHIVGSVPFSREHGFSDGSILLDIYIGVYSPMWTAEAVGSTHRRDRLETALSDWCPGRFSAKGRWVLSHKSVVNAGSLSTIYAVYGGFSSDRQWHLQPSLVPLRYDINVRPMTSIPLRYVSVQAAMGMGRGVPRVVMPSGEARSGGSVPLLTTPPRPLWQGFRYVQRVKSTTSDTKYAAAVSLGCLVRWVPVACVERVVGMVFKGGILVYYSRVSSQMDSNFGENRVDLLGSCPGFGPGRIRLSVSEVTDAVNAVRSPKMVLFRAGKTRSADTNISTAIAGLGIPKRGRFRASVMDAVAVDAVVDRTRP